MTPFALLNDGDRRVSALLDARLLEHPTINCHPLENTATTNIAREDLFAGRIPACGHEPQVIAFDGR